MSAIPKPWLGLLCTLLTACATSSPSLLPQEEGLARWFQRQGVPDIHQFTLLIPEHIHIRIHSGGQWNAAWRQFRDAHQDATPAEIYRHAGELIFRFELTGPIVPYSRRR